MLSNVHLAMNDKPSWRPQFLTGISLIAFGCLSLNASAVASDSHAVAEQVAKRDVFSHFLRAVGNESPPAAESLELLSVLESADRDVQFSRLTDFVQRYPGSSWTPSVQAVLGLRCRDTGRQTAALDYWTKSWQATRQSQSGPGKEVADTALANWAHLLASLGRRGQLAQLLAEAQNRPVHEPTLAKRLSRAKESLSVMRDQPGAAYRCGTLALTQVAQVLQPSNRNVSALLDVPAPGTNGFTMTDLVELSKKNNLGLAPVARSGQTEIPVPALVHWRFFHYAAIVGQEKGFYLIADPVFERKQWIRKDVVDAEASGNFLITESQITPAWRKLRRDETDQIFGTGACRTTRTTLMIRETPLRPDLPIIDKPARIRGDRSSFLPPLQFRSGSSRNVQPPFPN